MDGPVTGKFEHLDHLRGAHNRSFTPQSMKMCQKDWYREFPWREGIIVPPTVLTGEQWYGLLFINIPVTDGSRALQQMPKSLRRECCKPFIQILG